MNIVLAEMTDEDYKNICLTFPSSDQELEFLNDYKVTKGKFFKVISNNQMVGLAQIIKGRQGYIYIYIGQSFRNHGIGSKAYDLCEKLLLTDETQSISTSYNSKNQIARLFANKHHFKRKFESVKMKYSGSKFPSPSMTIRGYCDEDYYLAQELYARSFHEMRVSVGDFPESVVEIPSEKQKIHWQETSNQRYVCIEDETIVGLARVLENEIVSISVKSEYQGRGIGKNFIKLICNQILSNDYNSVSLWCVVGNKAKFLYESLGFEDTFTGEFAEKIIKN